MISYEFVLELAIVLPTATAWIVSARRNELTDSFYILAPLSRSELCSVPPADAYFGRAQAFLKQRERIKRKTIKYRRLQHLPWHIDAVGGRPPHQATDNVKDAVRIAIDRLGWSTIFTLPGPTHEVKLALPVIIDGLARKAATADLVEAITTPVRATLSQHHDHFK